MFRKLMVIILVCCPLLAVLASIGYGGYTWKTCRSCTTILNSNFNPCKEDCLEDLASDWWRLKPLEGSSEACVQATTMDCKELDDNDHDCARWWKYPSEIDCDNDQNGSAGGFKAVEGCETSRATSEEC